MAASFLWNVKQGHVRKLSEVRTKDEFGVGRYAFTASHPGMVKWNRAFSVALGIISIILTYLITLRLINNQVAGYLAGLLVAVAPALVARDPIIGVDVVMTTACLAAVYASLRLFDHFSLGALFVAGILAGLAVSSKYNALPIALVPLVFCIVDARINFKTVLIAFCAPLAGFLAGSPYILS